ncbi:MAG: acyl-CoA dehydrogenase family protein, partial [Thermodesulfobacteriota bacterium]|nr:acyl-CoA dehydrogenase family protein [Thermodesulfobacteriota bacterium]
MDYIFTEEQELFRNAVIKFVKQEIVPCAQELGNLDEIPRHLWKKICDLGIMTILAPKEYGGQPNESTMLGIAAEEIAKGGDMSLASTIVPNIGFLLALGHASSQVQEEWIPPITGGEKLGAFAITEPDCGTDAVAMRTAAKKEGDFYILNGEKTSVSWGMYAEASVVFVKTDPNAGARGVSCFLLPLDLEGIVKSSFPDMGLRPVTRASLILDNVRIPTEYLIGGEGEGFYTAMKGFDVMRVIVALISIGTAENVMEATIEYVKQRVAFGKPLGKYEGISFRIAEAFTLLEAARGLSYKALWLRDHGLNHTKETAMTKWWS